ncbi:ester cyclase [bacterium]|nr:MAG: ester cyclase [bacterium]
MSSDNVQLTKRWFNEVWNKGDLDVIDELFAQDGIAYGLGEHGRDVRGPEGFKPFVQRLRAAFPDLQITVDDAIEQDNRVAARFSAVMTHTGDALGFPATGREVRVQGISFSHFHNGQLVEAWNNWDIYGMMQQLQVPVAPVSTTLLEESDTRSC